MADEKKNKSTRWPAQHGTLGTWEISWFSKIYDNDDDDDDDDEEYNDDEDDDACHVVMTTLCATVTLLVGTMATPVATLSWLHCVQLLLC